MRWPRPPRRVRQWLRRWAQETLRAVDAWDDQPGPQPATPREGPQEWLRRVRAAPDVAWTQAEAGPDRWPEPPAPLATRSGRESSAPRRPAPTPALTFSGTPPSVPAPPVFPPRAAGLPGVRTEVREVPFAGRVPAPLRFSVQPVQAVAPRPSPPNPAAAPVGAPRAPWPPASPVVTALPPAWPPSAGPGPEAGVLTWPAEPSRTAAGGPPPTPPAGTTGREAAWPVAPEQGPGLHPWPALPVPPDDALGGWLAAQREQERWRELRLEQAGERWNASTS